MDSYYQSILASVYRNIEYYESMIASSTNDYQRNYYESLLNNERVHLTNLENYHHYRNYLEMQQNQGNESEERVFTVEELAQYDGSDGNPAYVAVNGVVYDVSLVSRWRGGTHFSLRAGRDLSN